MRIEKLELKNFRGFEDLTINFPEDNNVAVFIGKNGSGKSSILDALYLVTQEFYFQLSTHDLCNILPDSYEEIMEKMVGEKKKLHKKFDIKKTADNYSIGLAYENPDYSFKIIFDKMNNYKVENYTEFKKDLLNVECITIFNYHKSNRLFDNAERHSFKEFVKWFVENENLENEEKLAKKDLNYKLPLLEPVRNAVNSFLVEIEVADLHNLRVNREKEGKKLNESTELDIYSKLMINKGEEVFLLDQLSKGEKSIILLVSYIAMSLAIVSESENVLNNPGIVLIDKIEMYLYPDWQRKILPALTKTFPNIQFIVTTHSPQVVSSLDRESVFILEDFKVVQNTPYTKGRDANSILSEVFGVSTWTKEFQEKINKLYTFIDDEKTEEALKALKELEKDFGPDDLELMRANMFLDFMEEEVYNKNEG